MNRDSTKITYFLSILTIHLDKLIMNKKTVPYMPFADSITLLINERKFNVT